MDKDTDDMIQRDVQKFKQIRSTGRPSLPAVIEGFCWSVMILGVIWTVGTMWWVGADGIPGGGWIAVTVGATGFGLAFGLGVRWLRTNAGQIDRAMEQRFNS